MDETTHNDPAHPATRLEWWLAEAEFEQQQIARSTARAWASIVRTLDEAREHHELFVDAPMLRGDATEVAERAAIADLAVRLSMSEQTVRTHDHTARTLMRCSPVVWSRFADGATAVANARECAARLADLPAAVWPAFEAAVLPLLGLAPAAFTRRVRRIAARLHDDPDRVQLAREQRRVIVEQNGDGTAWLFALLPDHVAARAMTALDHAAFGLLTAPGETRTIPQLRADVLGEWLAGGGISHSGGGTSGTAATHPSTGVGVSVALTVPLLTLLGHGDEPAVLEGVGPMDAETARRLAADAPSFERLLTDPVDGRIIAVDPRAYRPTAAQRRWLRHRDETCTFPNCGVAARRSDLDHVTDWAAGGTTTIDNLAHLCRKHHTLKHQSRWRVARRDGVSAWTSPTGRTGPPDSGAPPPR